MTQYDEWDKEKCRENPNIASCDMGLMGVR